MDFFLEEKVPNAYLKMVPSKISEIKLEFSTSSFCVYLFRKESMDFYLKNNLKHRLRKVRKGYRKHPSANCFSSYPNFSPFNIFP
jgi:hypothetical protein